MSPKTRMVRFRRIVDLSLPIGPSTPMFPAYPPPSFTQWTTREVHGFLAESLFLISHTGTHVDAPFHFEPGGKRLDEVDLGRFFAPGHVLDLRRLHPRESIRAAQVRAASGRLAETVHRRDAVLVRTGWEKRRGTPAFLFENPGLGREAAEEIAGWGPAFVGVDSPNLDAAGAPDYPAHHALLAADIPVVENVVNLGALGSAPFTLAAFPLRLQGTSGSPIRLVALVE